MSRAVRVLLLVLVCLVVSRTAPAEDVTRAEASAVSRQSLTDRSLNWPTLSQWRRVLLLEDYNTRIVLLGTTLLGCTAGMVGSFTLLRKRALMGDALSHATLPGICLAFLATAHHASAGKAIVPLLIGATATGLLGVGAILLMRNLTRLKEDTALGAVLSVFFGAGVALLGVIQQMQSGHAAGLESFIYGKTASMGAYDIQLIAGAAAVCLAVSLLLFKEFKILCFDEGYAGSRGLPVVALDLTLMALVVTVTIVGLQAVGLVLMVALLVIPAAAARFWTETLARMFLISGVLGAFSGLAGAAISALFSKLPSGAMIVLVCALIFLVSLIFGPSRGVLVRAWRRLHLNRQIERQHLLRAIYELNESTRTDVSGTQGVGRHELLAQRSWSPRQLSAAIDRARRAELVDWTDPIRLTRRGQVEATRLTRQHRLWELYLITHADIAPSRVDRDADAIEHVLEPELIAELEALLAHDRPAVPHSPHALSETTAQRESAGDAR